MRITKPNMATVLAAPFILSGATFAADNVLTRLIPDLYAGMDVVSRELVGFIPSVTRNVSAERAMVGQSVVYPVTEGAELFDVTPSNIIPDPDNVTVGHGEIKITKSKGVEFGWVGEEQKGLNTGAGVLTVQADLFAQALRKLTNTIERDLAVEAAIHASRAYGTAGQVPFQTNVGDTAQVRKILDDNGAPLSDRSLVINTSAGAALRTLNNLTRVNEAGTSMGLRDGQLLDLNGLSIKESAGVVDHVAGTAAGATTTAAGFAEGVTVIAIAAAGTGAIKAGDVISFAGDTNKYVVTVGLADVSAGGSITIAKPGILNAVPAVATAITVTASHAANIGFSRNALHLVCRAPALPQGGDAAVDRMTITDPRSGLAFEVSVYHMYRKIRMEVTLAWGVKAVKEEHIAMLLG